MGENADPQELNSTPDFLYYVHYFWFSKKRTETTRIAREPVDICRELAIPYQTFIKGLHK